MERLRAALQDDLVLLDLESGTLAEILLRAVERGIDRNIIPADAQQRFYEELLQREQKVSTAIGHAVAIPHAYVEGIPEPSMIFVRLARPLNMGAPDGVPTQYLFVLIGPPGQAGEHLDTLTSIARLMSDDEFRYDLHEADSVDDILRALEAFEERTAPVAERPEEAVTTGLEYTGRLAGGLFADLRRRLPHYADDYLCGLHPKALSSTVFLYFACLAPAVTFGGIMGDLTGGYIGVVEMILASAVCGVAYAVLAGQPMIILGVTGPQLIFTMILYNLCDPQHFDVPFLETRAWVGGWTAAMLLAFAVTDASCLMRFFTRFTDEIFASLISLIFIYAAINSLTDIFTDEDTPHDTALLSLLLALGTFYLAMSLSRFRKSRYLIHRFREFFADFGPALALAAMTAVAIWSHEISLDPLIAEEHASLRPSVDRSWLINPFLVPRWVWWASAGPALLVTVLVFAEQNIAARLVNNRDNNLAKGPAYHWDLALTGLLIGACSLFGLPWLVAATVRSLNHLRSLATVEEVVTARGDKHEKIIHVRETRLTGIAIHVLIGLSLLLLPVLRHVPMAVLYGLILYMGVVSMAGNQFFERLNLWLVDPSLYPSTHYIRKVPIKLIHLFTLIQLFCLLVLGLVQASPLSILFPLFIVLLVPIRLMLPRWFSPQHLAALDAEERPEEEASEWV